MIDGAADLKIEFRTEAIGFGQILSLTLHSTNEFHQQLGTILDISTD